MASSSSSSSSRSGGGGGGGVGRPPSSSSGPRRLYGGPLPHGAASTQQAPMPARYSLPVLPQARNGSGAAYGTYAAHASAYQPQANPATPQRAAASATATATASATNAAAAATASAAAAAQAAYRARNKRGRLERRLPADIDESVPESKLYNATVQMEKKLDTALLRRRLEREDALRRAPRTKRILRIFVSNLAANQPHFAQNEVVDYLPEQAYPQPPSWTLRIEGRLLDHGASKRAGVPPKFSSFVSALYIEFERNADQQPGLDPVEWKPTTNSVEMDGFEVKRLGDEPVNARIILHLKWSPPRLKVRAALAQLIGIQSESHAAVLMALYKYIKANKLQSIDDRNAIVLNEPLKQIFDVDHLTFATLAQAVYTQLEPADPIVLNYRINLDSPYNLADVAYDVELDVDDTFSQQQRAEPMPDAHLRELDELNTRIADGLSTIHAAKRKRDFMTAFATHPAHFINAWLDTQARDLKVILGENAIGADEQRRSALFQQPWVKEAAAHYLSDRVRGAGPTAGAAQRLVADRALGGRTGAVDVGSWWPPWQAAERSDALMRPARHSVGTA